ncbi:MAG: PocR ligand-binding domain-containing protein [Spirochaetales bacterium]|nr:PocR ligand-binding domain-containing protein [Spirochaetales bacterium]
MENEISSNRAIIAAQDYHLATGINCTVIDATGNIIIKSDDTLICSHCKFRTDKISEEKKCGDIHLYGIYQAERFGGKYIYFCSMSLMHWVSPLIKDGGISGGLVCGPVLAYNHDDFQIDILEDEYFHEKTNFKLFKQKLKSLPYVKPSRVKSLSELLFITSSYLSDRNYSIIEQGKTIEQQSEISSYIQYIKTMECNPEIKQRYPIEKEKELLAQIVNADFKGAKKTLNEILGSVFFSSGNDFEIIKSRVLELVVLLSRAALEGGADVEQIFGLNYQYLNRIHSFTRVEELSYWLTTIMGRFTDLVFTLKSVKHTDAIFKAIQFISEHYTEKTTLDDVAGEVFLSSAYFSKIFKEQTGSNFSQYLNKLRIDKSKSLLRNSRIPLVEIAGMVGYEDQSYYSKVFKKITGNSPGKYRDTRGLIESDNHEIH